MGRSRTYADDAVVAGALDAFWRTGYETTAVPDLERATGLSRSSLYHAFGSKRGLFDAAVNAYLDGIVHPLLAPLRGESVPVDALDRYLTLMRTAMTDPAGRLAGHGCLLLNVATSPSVDDPTLGAVVRAYRDELAAAFARGVAAAKPALDAEAADRLATAITAQVIAAMTLVRVDPEGAAALIDNARDMLAA